MKLSDFYNDIGFVLAFLVMVLVIEMTLGNKVTNYFLWLVLFSVILVNADSFISFMEEAFQYE